MQQRILTTLLSTFRTRSSFLDFGNWLTSVMVVSGFALPVTLAHSGVIHSMASIMAMVGGGLVYGTSESSTPSVHPGMQHDPDVLPPFSHWTQF